MRTQPAVLQTTRPEFTPPFTVHHAIEQMVAGIYAIPVEELRAPTRRKADVAFARQVAMYLSHVAGGMTLTEVGRLFGRDRTTAAHACRLIEDRRDDPRLDFSLDHIEEAIRLMILAAGCGAVLQKEVRHAQ